MRLVLDTNIVISGLIWGGMPRRLLDLAHGGQVELFTSAELLEEFTDVLQRNKFSSLLAAHSLTPTFLMQRYGMLAKLVKPAVITPISRDLDDDIVLATAIAEKADLIVSGDKDLLSIGIYEGMVIVSAASAVSMLQLK